MSTQSVNKVILIGRIGNEPKVSDVGKTIKLSFSVATDRVSKKEVKPAPYWHNIGIFGKLAESIQQYLTKGKLVYIEGELTYWQDKDENYHTEVQCHELRMLSYDKDKKDK